MAIDSSTALNGSTIANLLDRAWCVGVESSTGKVLEMVSQVEKTYTLNGDAVFGSDADGNYVEIVDAGDSMTIPETVDPSDSGLTFIVHWKPAVVPAGATFANVACLENSTGPLMGLAYSNGSDMALTYTPSGYAPFSDSTAHLSSDTLVTNVITWDGETATLFTGEQSPITFSVGTPQTTGATDNLRLGAALAFGNPYEAKIYFVGIIANSALSDTDAQAVANDIEAELFSAAGSVSRIINGGLTAGTLVNGSIAR